MVAIGETGLDYHYDHAPRETQREVFKRQLEIASELDLPVIVHTRNADADTEDLLRRFAPRRGVLHCFTSGAALADAALEIGFMISFSGIATFPNAKDLIDIVRKVPSDRILIETDCPYLAPVPHRGKRNEPAFVADTAKFIAKTRDVDTGTAGIGDVSQLHSAFFAGGQLTPQEIYQLVVPDLVRVEEELQSYTHASIRPIADIGEHVLMAGGKRIRPALLLLTANMLGDVTPSMIRLAAVVELIHNATLVHDDIIDDADTRRGRPSVNAQWGNSMTVLAGDWLYMQSFNVALGERNLDILSTLIEITQQMVEGEMLQLTLARQNRCRQRSTA